MVLKNSMKAQATWRKHERRLTRDSSSGRTVCLREKNCTQAASLPWIRVGKHFCNACWLLPLRVERNGCAQTVVHRKNVVVSRTIRGLPAPAVQHDTATPLAPGLHQHVPSDEFNELVLATRFRAAMKQPVPSTQHTP